MAGCDWQSAGQLVAESEGALSYRRRLAQYARAFSISAAEPLAVAYVLRQRAMRHPVRQEE